MTQGNSPRPSSLIFPVSLIALGGIFLYANWHPDFDPGAVLFRYWPILLILIGLGMIWDRYRQPLGADAPQRHSSAGTTLGIVAIVLVLLMLVWHGHARWHRSWQADFRGPVQHGSQIVDAQGAKSVRASIEMGAGELTIDGGSPHLLDANFDYRLIGPPHIDYSVSDAVGRLDISQGESGPHFGNTQNFWNLVFAENLPLELKISMGAGQSNLRFRNVNLSRLDIQMGAGQLNLDLTGDRKANLDAAIEGGVGETDIRLPRNVGVVVNASGGMGSIEAGDLRESGHEYTNDAYGKTSSAIHLTVHGGIGSIRLLQEP